MRIFLILLIISFFSTTSFANFVSCKSTDNQLSVSLKSLDGNIIATKFYHPVNLREINESLPAGIYANTQDINEHINFYFEDEAFIEVTPIESGKLAKIQMIGLGAAGPRLVVLSKTLRCEQSLL